MTTYYVPLLVTLQPAGSRTDGEAVPLALPDGVIGILPVYRSRSAVDRDYPDAHIAEFVTGEGETP